VVLSADATVSDGGAGSHDRRVQCGYDEAVSARILDGRDGWLSLAYKAPDRFAAVVIVAGRVQPGVNYTQEEIAVDRATNSVVANSDPFSALAEGLRKIPMWIFHGDADETVPVDQSRRLVAALRRLGAPVRYTEFPGANHETAPPKAYAEAELFGWLLSQHR
jgi:Predicted peptidase